MQHTVLTKLSKDLPGQYEQNILSYQKTDPYMIIIPD